jgi:DNA-binding GntR family transcriptional regulator
MERIPVAEKTEKAYQLIKERILTGQLSSREPVSLSTLAEELAISRTPIRDALHRLKVEGFVLIFPNQGVIVKEMTSIEVTQMYELRLALEGFLLRRAISLFSKQDIASLRGLLNHQREAMENNDSFAFMRYDNEQHLYIHKIYHNPFIFNVLNRMADRIYYGGVQALKMPGRMQATLGEHVRLVDAIEQRNADLAIQTLEDHFNLGLTSTIRSIGQV